MKIPVTRRSFLKTNAITGLASVAGGSIFPSILRNILSGNAITGQNKVTHIWSIRKELYVPSPGPRVGTSLSMSYIGSGLKRQEIRAIIRSSDWVEKP